MAEKKGRNWATIVYPESCSPEWISTIEALKIPCFISPLHDGDVKDTGEIKKPHYHVLFMFTGPVTEKYVRDIILAIGGAGCIRVADKKGMARYLCHLDTPKKAQYSTDDVISLGDVDYYKYVTNKEDRVNDMQMEMERYIYENGIKSYCEFSLYCADNNREWYRVLQKRHRQMIEFIKSVEWTLKDE